MIKNSRSVLRTLTCSILTLTSLVTFSSITHASQIKDFKGAKVVKTGQKRDMVKDMLLAEFKKNLSSKEVSKLKKQALTYSGKAIPALVEVMKSDRYPDKNRWVATFLVGRIMGKKSSPFLAKFLKHPNWVLRMASLKTLLALKEKKLAAAYAKALKDRSFIVRKQALENIRRLGLKKKAANVWGMLYDKRNYYNPKDGQKKRTNLIREAIKTVGDLEFKKATEPLLSMVQKDKYQDIFEEIDYSLMKITGKKSPEDTRLKKRFWKKIAISYKTL